MSTNLGQFETEQLQLQHNAQAPYKHLCCDQVIFHIENQMYSNGFYFISYIIDSEALTHFQHQHIDTKSKQLEKYP